MSVKQRGSTVRSLDLSQWKNGAIEFPCHILLGHWQPLSTRNITFDSGGLMHWGGLMHCRQLGYSGWFWNYGLIRKRGMPCFNQPGTVLGSSVNPGCSRSTCKSNCSCKGLQQNNPVQFTNFGFKQWSMALPNIFGIGDLHLEIPPARSFIDYSS